MQAMLHYSAATGTGFRRTLLTLVGVTVEFEKTVNQNKEQRADFIKKTCP